jgi:protease IV
VLFLIFFFFLLLIVFAHFTMQAFQDENSRLTGKGEVIAIVEVEGVIMASEPIIEMLHRAEKEKNVKAIIMRIDSPGGAVGPTQEIYNEIRRIDSNFTRLMNDEELEFPERAKPIFSSFGSIAASGGYYIGAATRQIYSNPGTLTGSIGVIMQFMDLSKLYEFAKINPQTLKAGRYKDVGQPTRALNREEEGLMGEMLASVHKQFVDDILKLREEKIQGDIWELAQGQIFSGQEAFNSGLVDKLGSLWDAGREIHKTLDLKGELDLVYFRKKDRSSFWELLDTLDQVATNLGLKGSNTSHPRLMYVR